MKQFTDDKKDSATIVTPIESIKIQPKAAPVIKPAHPKKKKSSFNFISRLFQPKVFEVNSALVEKGIEITLAKGADKHTFQLEFPEEAWKAFPSDSKNFLRDNLSFLSSIELGVMFNAKKIKYNTPLPLFKSFFMELLLRCLLYSGDCDSKRAVEYVTRLCNLELVFKSEKTTSHNFTFATSEKSINTLTFGKESLLGFALAQEIGLDPVPVIIIEPDSDVVYRNVHLRTFEEAHKNKLIPEFEKEFNLKVQRIRNEWWFLRDYTLWDLDKTDLGWSSQLTQYLFFLLPFNYAFSSKYMIYGNEYSCDTCYYNEEGFRCHLVYDQSPEWISHMNTILNTVTNSMVKATSLVQPLHEIAVAKLLYQRYPQYAKYQMSCHADNENAQKSRWCCSCAKCATCFAYMKALGFDPLLAELKEDMFTAKFKDLYCIFNEGKGLYSNPLGKEEQLFAFHLAAKRGVKGELIDLFIEKYGIDTASREDEFRNEFFKVHRPLNIPNPLWKKLKPIFEEELKKPEVLSEVKEVKKEE
ncbi:hypothetical protein HZC30_00645 [Candidatus Woesearchaeota archaeon]|nr:hypothetical protein [Candidatus Woesearchaeota archaeon]